LKKKEIIKYLLFALIGVLVVYFIQRDFSFREFMVYMKIAKIQYVLISVFVGVLAVLIRALRWQLMLKPMGYETSLSNAYHATMSGYLVNLGIPRSGEVYRCAVFSKSDNIPVNVLVGTVLSERILDLFMLLLVIIGSVMLQFDLLYDYINVNLLSKLRDNKIALVLVGLILLGGLVFVFKAKKIFNSKTKLGKLFLGFFDGIKSIFTLKQPVLFILYTIAIWVCYWLMTYTVLLAFDFSAHLGAAGGLSTLVFSSLGVIVPAPAGSATLLSIFVGLNEIYSIPLQQAKALGVVMFSSNIIMIILAGTISYVVMAKRTKA
jgi:uncharacterized protein (TIRG00374 family)